MKKKGISAGYKLSSKRGYSSSSSTTTGFYNPLAGFSLLIFEDFEITHKGTPQSVGLLWTSDQPVAETST
jgi:hypothetical protein